MIIKFVGDPSVSRHRSLARARMRHVIPLPAQAGQESAPVPHAVALPIEIMQYSIKSNNLKKILDDVGISQEEAARRCDVSYRHFNRIVMGHSEPSLLLALKMEKVLNCTIDKMFTFTVKTRRAQAA